MSDNPTIGWEVGPTEGEVGPGAPLSFRALTAPMVASPELAVHVDDWDTSVIAPVFVFHVIHDLGGAAVRLDDVLGAVRVSAGLAVHDGGEIDLFVSGKQDPCDFDLSLVGCLFEMGGVLQATAAGAAVLGHPAEAVVRLCRWLDTRGEILPHGNLVCSPSVTAPLPVRTGEVTTRFGRLGAVTVTVTT